MYLNLIGVGSVRMVCTHGNDRLHQVIHAQILLYSPDVFVNKRHAYRVLIIQESHTTQKYQELVERLKHIGGQKLGRHVVHCRFFNRKLLTGTKATNI